MAQKVEVSARPWAMAKGEDSQALPTTSPSSASSTGRAPGRRRRVKKSSQLVKPQCGWPGSQTKVRSKSPISRRASSQNQPRGDSSVRYLQDAGEAKNFPQSQRILSMAWFTRGSLKAAKPASVAIGQLRIALIGKPTSPVVLNSGGSCMI